MKIIYHEKFLTPYPTAGVENPGRNGCRFALLEGGYYLPDLGQNCLAFLNGLA